MRNVAAATLVGCRPHNPRYVQVPAAACADRARCRVRLPPRSFNPPPTSAVRAVLRPAHRPAAPKGAPLSKAPASRSRGCCGPSAAWALQPQEVLRAGERHPPTRTRERAGAALNLKVLRLSDLDAVGS
jgi:hypothetical protein